MNIWGNDLVITSGATHNLSTLPGQPNRFLVTGSATLSAGTVIQLDPALTPTKWDSFMLHYKAVVNLGTGTLTIFGLTLNKEQASKESAIICVYDGSAWNVKLLLDASDLPSGATATETTAITAAGLVDTIDTDIQANYQIYTGSATLAGSVSITQAGTPKVGQEIWVDYRATLTQVANTVTILGQLLTAEQALVGNILVYSLYDGSAWRTTVTKSAIGAGAGMLWEAGSGVESCQRLNATTGCQATGDFSVAEGHLAVASGTSSHAEGDNTTASGNYSHSEGNSTTASASYSHAEGDSSTASGSASHAEGGNTTASGSASHAEGGNTLASGANSHAEGLNTKATGDSSHAGGIYSVSPYEGSKAHSSGRFSLTGDSQELSMELIIQTIDATPTNLKGADGTDGIIIPTDCSANVNIRFIAVQTNNAGFLIGATLMQNIELCVKNVAGTSSIDAAYATTVSGVHTVTGNVIYKDAMGTLATGVSVAVSVAANKIQVTFTGGAGQTIRTKALVSMSWIGYRNFTV